MYNDLKELVKLELTNISLNGLRKTSLRPLYYFKEETEIDDSKFASEMFVLNYNLVNLITGTVIFYQDIPAVYDN